jgi:hypothetical protein
LGCWKKWRQRAECSAGVEESTVQRKLCKVKSERKEVFGGAEGTSQ